MTRSFRDVLDGLPEPDRVATRADIDALLDLVAEEADARETGEEWLADMVKIAGRRIDTVTCRAHSVESRIRERVDSAGLRAASLSDRIVQLHGRVDVAVGVAVVSSALALAALVAAAGTGLGWW